MKNSTSPVRVFARQAVFATLAIIADGDFLLVILPDDQYTRQWDREGFIWVSSSRSHHQAGGRRHER